MIEVTFRMPPEELKAIAALIAGTDRPREQTEESGGENGSFRREVYEQRQEQEELSRPASLRAEVTAARELSAPEPASYAVELPGTEAFRGGELPKAEPEPPEPPSPEDMERRWERDSRRYDSGFPLY